MWSNWQNFNRAIIKLKTKTKWFNFLIIILSATIFGLSFNFTNNWFTSKFTSFDSSVLGFKST